MPELSAGSLVLVVVVALFTAAAAVWDIRQRRIPNALTLPVFAAGWVYQAVFHGWQGLGQGALGFLVGFGVLFVLWIIGGGGGGDVKLMGALSVWLGFRLTLLVLIVSTIIVVLVSGGAIAWSIATGTLQARRRKHLATGKADSERRYGAETVEQKQQRRIMAYALPVALATWAVMAWKLPTLP